MPGEAEHYSGRIRKFGLDIGVTGRVGASSGPCSRRQHAYVPGSLAGDYAGVSAEATVGLGLGANVLVGGRQAVDRASAARASRPGAGLNLAAGVTAIRLDPR